MLADEEMIRGYFMGRRHPSNRELYDLVESVDEIVRTDPVRGWEIVNNLIHAASSEEDLGYVAAGPLEDLLRLHGAGIASIIRESAIRNQRVRDALGCVLLDPIPETVFADLGPWLIKL